MASNIVVSLFEVESEAYQAITQLKQYPGDDRSFVSAAILVKKENDELHTLDAFDTGINTIWMTLQLADWSVRWSESWAARSVFCSEPAMEC